MLNELYATERAKLRLKQLAEGRYHHLGYEVNETSSGRVGISCNVYVEDYGFFSADTWEKALEKLKNWMEVKPRE
ncbi:MAG: hypothetical protein JRI72_16345 [Deltaproteobacteria bacterium]|nr:hypothetical protein [Deltaproteobacteria bacterium]